MNKVDAEDKQRLKEWIIQSFPIMARAFSIVIQENRINEIEGCREILKSCPMEIPYEMGVSNRGWINANERLPEWEAPVLGLVAISPDPVIRIAALSRVDKRGRMWYLDGYGSSYAITHWRPLPNPPTAKGRP